MGAYKMISEKLDEFIRFIDENGEQVNFKYKELPSPEDYFNKYTLCGVFLTDDKKWKFVHQDFPAEGDRPSAYFYEKEYDLLDELIEKETKRSELKIKIANEPKPCIEKVSCPACLNVIKKNTANIPIGNFYEVKCNKCGMLIRKKRL